MSDRGNATPLTGAGSLTHCTLTGAIAGLAGRLVATLKPAAPSNTGKSATRLRPRTWNLQPATCNL